MYSTYNEFQQVVMTSFPKNGQEVAYILRFKLLFIVI